jgi:hypothetical protein
VTEAARPLGRDAFLAHVGHLAEEAVDVPGMGLVLCRELTGTQRAKVLEVLAPAVQEGGRVDLGRYQQMLLQLGLIDPESPADARQPLLDFATSAKAMELGAGKVELLCSTVERLSGLAKAEPVRAEGNSSTDLSSSTISA